MILRITTAPVSTENGNKIRGTELINLKLSPESNNWGYSTSPKSKMQQILNTQKKHKPEELKGTLVTLRVRTKINPDGTETELLGFIY